MLYRILFLVVVGLMVCTVIYADVPKLINFQGRLTDVSGKFVPDGVCTLTVSIYTDPDVGVPKWSETNSSVTVSKGLFNVILGSTNTIPDSIFTYANLWLGIKVNGDPEMTPRQRLTSVGYAYRSSKTDTSYYSINSDKLDGLHASDFTSPASDYGRSGVATDLYEGTSTLTSKYVNTVGPDSVYSTSGTAFKGRVSGSSASTMSGIRGYADNTSTGYVSGGYFETSSSGAGIHDGVIGNGYGSSTSHATGVAGYAQNTSTGNAHGGYFWTDASGTGDHFGVIGLSNGSSSNSSIGSYGYAKNTSTGGAFGGMFQTIDSLGTGYHNGVTGTAISSSSYNADGVVGYAYNKSTGNAYGGHFWTDTSGTGTKYGVSAYAPSSEGYAGYFYGNFAVAGGTKSAGVKVDNGEYRLLYSQESPENWFEDFGEAQLINGIAHVELDPLFLQTVTIDNLHPMKVFIQLRDDCKGTYVKTSNTGFDVFEIQSGTSNAAFSYRVVAKRKGYEDVRLAKMLGSTPEEIAAEHAKNQAEFEKERASIRENDQR